MKKLLLIGIAGAASLAAGVEYRREIEQWREQREAELKAEDGWLTVTGLFWLKPGENRIGTGEGDEICLPPRSAPARVGKIRLAGEQVRLEAAEGVEVQVNGRRARSAELHADASGNPDVVTIGRLKLLLLKRGERYAIRLKDNQSRLRKEFAGLRWYPVEESWRVTAKFVRYPAPRKMAFDTVVGIKEELDSPGYVTFTREGKEYRLEAAREGGKLFLVFRDLTSGKTTYGGARFLYAEEPRAGRVALDFNKAINPPCAFTPYATCPLAPRQNRLGLAITAGEMDTKH